jgi:cystathionine beta-lyase family protein involved in aluminum resistance
MQSIGTFFDKFKNAAGKEIALRQSVIDAINKNISAVADGSVDLRLNLKDIDIRNKIIRIRSSPALKNQIFIKKESILKSIRETNPQTIITDVQ